jgi:hypothetical protein
VSVGPVADDAAAPLVVMVNREGFFAGREFFYQLSLFKDNFPLKKESVNSVAIFKQCIQSDGYNFLIFIFAKNAFYSAMRNISFKMSDFWPLFAAQLFFNPD